MITTMLPRHASCCSVFRVSAGSRVSLPIDSYLMPGASGTFVIELFDGKVESVQQEIKMDHIH